MGFCQALTLVACAPNRSFQQDLRFVAWIGASAALRAAAASVQLFSPLFQPALHSTSHAVGGTALTVASSAAGLLLAFFLLRPAWLGRAWDADDARPAHRRGTGVPSALAWLGIQGLKHATWTVLTLATVVIACAEYAGVRLEPWAALLLLLAVVSTFRVSGEWRIASSLTVPTVLLNLRHAHPGPRASPTPCHTHPTQCRHMP